MSHSEQAREVFTTLALAAFCVCLLWFAILFVFGF